ncbi:MAG TPA: cyanophycin synthetase, partial [Candidatus Acidoferrum sp.]|nr:cyanophycin synthetase [Candidatus Acidoferrum sp.]
TLRPPAMRGELLRFSNGAALINDCYNSSPAALQAMTALLATTPNYRRRILAAGEMRELGPESAKLHREAGKFAAETGAIDWILAVSGDASEIAEGAVSAGLPLERTKFFRTSEEAARFLEGFLEPGDLLLVKGSRGVKMEVIVDALIARQAPGEFARQEAKH